MWNLFVYGNAIVVDYWNKVFKFQRNINLSISPILVSYDYTDKVNLITIRIYIKTTKHTIRFDWTFGVNVREN